MVEPGPSQAQRRGAETARRLLAGERRAIARAISFADADAPEAGVIDALLREHLGLARTVGVTGAPGAGKSTLVDALIRELRSRGRSVAVIAVDPSSPISGGAVLGDRVRMAAGASDDGVFIRSLAARGHLGGLSRSTRRAVSVLDAAGYDFVVIETVGAGQSETEVAGLARTCLVVVPPGTGDRVQAEKAGILEVADLLVINKADLPDADATEADLRSMLALRAPDRRDVPVLRTVATTGEGVPKLADAIEARPAGTAKSKAEWAAKTSSRPALEFRSESKLSQLLDPRRNFEPVSIESEVRFDPLTGDSSRICHFSLAAAPPADLDAMLAASRKNCPFCAESVTRVTPRYPDAFAPGGRLTRGEAVLFPNLFPYDEFSAVAVISREHSAPMATLAESRLADALKVARDFLARATGALDAAGRNYGIVAWNYMPPAGATQVHPHLQVLLTRHPGNALRRELDAETSYFRRHGRCFAADLLEREAGGPRWIGDSGRVAWLAPFAPAGVLGDCLAVFRGRPTLTALTDADVEEFCGGLACMLRGFAARGLWSFNLALLPDHEDAKVDAGAARHWLTARLVPRFYLNPALHVPDVAYLQLLLDERFAMAYPEDTARHLRGFFG